MSKKQGYKASTPNTSKGLKTHGSFKNDGQKPGKKAMVGKEKIKNQEQYTFMKKVVNDLRKQGLRKQNMLPGTGAFH